MLVVAPRGTPYIARAVARSSTGQVEPHIHWYRIVDDVGTAIRQFEGYVHVPQLDLVN